MVTEPESRPAAQEMPISPDVVWCEDNWTSRRRRREEEESVHRSVGLWVIAIRLAENEAADAVKVYCSGNGVCGDGRSLEDAAPANEQCVGARAVKPLGQPWAPCSSSYVSSHCKSVER